MVATEVKILDCRVSESLKMALSLLRFLCENFLEYPCDITIPIFIVTYSFPQHSSWFKNYKLLILKLVPGASLACAETFGAFLTRICYS